jgi:hypothetical protein
VSSRRGGAVAVIVVDSVPDGCSLPAGTLRFRGGRRG